MLTGGEVVMDFEPSSWDVRGVPALTSVTLGGRKVNEARGREKLAVGEGRSAERSGARSMVARKADIVNGGD
jgi:hypothetical protein